MTTSHSRSAAQEVPGVVKLKVHKSRGHSQSKMSQVAKVGRFGRSSTEPVVPSLLGSSAGIWVSGNSLELERKIRFETEDKHEDKCGTTVNVTEK